MSLHEYITSQEVSMKDYPFYGLLMALMRQADSENLAKLRVAFPVTWEELSQRYHAPGGILPEDG